MRKFLNGALGKNNLPVFASSTIIAVICLFFTSSSASGQGHAANSGSLRESERAAQVRALNNSVLQLHGQMQENTSGAAAIRGQAATVLAQRSAALQALIQEDPHAALTFAFSPELLADLAVKFPDSAARLESHVTLSGPIEHWIFDKTDLKSSKSLYKMNVGRQTVNLYFANQEPNLTKGGIFQVTGAEVGQTMAVETSASVPSSAASGPIGQSISAILLTMESLREQRWPMVPLFSLFILGLLGRAVGIRKFRGELRQFAAVAAAITIFASNPGATVAQTTCSTSGVQNVAVLLVTFPGITPPASVTPQSVGNIFFGATSPSLDGYWREASYGKTSAAGNVSGWYTLAGSYSCTNISQFITDAVTAAAASGVNFQSYNRVFIVFPDLSPSCGWAGLSSIGCYSVSTPSGTFTISTSTLVWNYLETTSQGVALAAHEGGHQLGLAHARLREFGTEPLGPLGTTGTLLEYGDHFASMGYPNLGHYGAKHKAEQLNWFASGVNYQLVQSSGTYTLQPYETNPAGLDALKIQRGTGNNAWLWLEYRQPIGNYDSSLYPTQPFSGALIHYEDAVTGPQTDLLDFTAPNTYSDNPALVAGQTWTDPYSNVSIAVVSASSTGLTVTVSYGAVPCTSVAPSVSVSPLNPSIYAGQSASYNVSVINNDSSACASSAINLTSSEPSGWYTSLSSSSVTLSPGQSTSLTLGKGAPSGTPAGTYAVNVSASNTSSTTSDTANATVVTPPTLAAALSVSGTNFTPPGSVSMNASVTTSGTPASGASVTFTVTVPNGNTSTQTATTGSNGTATWNYKLNAKSPAGTYSASAQATLSSSSGGKKTSASAQTALSNTVSFTVQ